MVLTVQQAIVHNFDKHFDFGLFNTTHIQMKGTGHHVIIFNPSHIRKSGKATFGKGRFWSGCEGRTQSRFEIGGIAPLAQFLLPNQSIG